MILDMNKINDNENNAEETGMTTRTGFIAIVGRPNVGKSTLLNALLGEKVAIVSKKPQTTRTRITGILTKGENQFVFLDTPGMHTPKTKLGKVMVKSITGAIADVDAAILVADASFGPGDIEKTLLERLHAAELPVLLVLNKTDIADKAAIAKTIQSYAQLCDFASVIPISAMKNDGVDIVLDEASKLLSEGDWIFDEDALTDMPEKQIASEIVREKLLRLLDDEIPHGTAVVIEDFKEDGKLLRIRAEIFCERESHKRIIIGNHGEMIKKISTFAREDMEAFFGTKVFLDLWVKVKENWRDSDFIINSFGFRPDDNK